MTPSYSKPIQVFGCAIDDQEIEASKQVLESHWLGMGPKVAQFESKFKSYGDLKHFLMVDSGSNALHLAVKLLNLPAGSEVVIPSLTWVACANAVKLAGHTPKFCDVELDTFNVSRMTIEKCLSKNTAALMVVHFAGYPVDLDPLVTLQYPIIEDAAHTAGGWYKNRLCGSIADVGIYSFNSVKNIASGGAGGIAIKSDRHAKYAARCRYQGIGQSGYEMSRRNQFPWWEYDVIEPFIKMLPCDLNAAVALAQLEKLPTNQQIRKKIWDKYQHELQNVPWIILPQYAPADCVHGYFTFVIRVVGRSRDLLAKYLLDKGIYTTVRFPPLHRMAVFEYTGPELPNTDTLYSESLCLPLHPGLSEHDVDCVIKMLRLF